MFRRGGEGEESIGEVREVRMGLLSEVDFGLGRPGGSPMLGSMLGAKLYEQARENGGCALEGGDREGDVERGEMHKLWR